LAVQGRPGYRRILHRPWFLIFYRIDETRRLVEIARVWDARQDPDMFALR
jgi:plasmid stabilization system protein ParE